MKKIIYISQILTCIFFLSCNVDSKSQETTSTSSDNTEEVGLPKRPNILWISYEDASQRLGCYGDEVANTPNIDKLASEGIRYTNTYTSAPVCAACRSGIITGMYQTSIGTQHMRTSHESPGLPTPYLTVPPPYVKAFTESLRANGYYCTNNFKTDYQFANFFYTPVSIWDECGYTADYANKEDADQPFFAVFNYMQTHEKYTWEQPKKTNPKDVVVPPYYPDTEKVRKSIARHYDNINTVDSLVGVHMKRLEEEGLLDNTIVFVWSDHGDGLPRGKRWPYDSGTKIPLIVKFPKNYKSGIVNDQLISSIDFGPTVLSLAGIKKPYHMQGRAFLGPDTEEEREYVFSARDRFDESYDMMRTVRNKKFRYVRNYYPNQPKIVYVPFRNRSPIMQELFRLNAEGKLNEDQSDWFEKTRDPEELFDCEADPHHLNNLAYDPKYKDVLNELRNELDDWRKETKDIGGLSEEQMVASMHQGKKELVTSSPYLIPNTEGNRNQKVYTDGDKLKAPMTMDLYCPTEGASIVYTFSEEEEPRWKLYSGPIQLEPGKYTLRTKAIRYGYSESKEVSKKLTVL